MPKELQHVFNQSFGIGPWNQHIARDFKLKIEKWLLPRQIRDRLVFDRALHELTISRQFLFAESAFVVGIKLDPGIAEDMREKLLGRKPRLKNLLPLEKFSGPFEDSADCPCPGVGHKMHSKEYGDGVLL